MGQGTQGPAPIQPPLPHSGVCHPLGTPNQHQCRVTGLLPADGPELGRHWDEGGTAPKVQSCPLLPAAHCPHRRGRGDWASAGQLRPLVAAVGRCRTCRQRANPIPSPAPRILCTALTYWRVAPGPARGWGGGGEWAGTTLFPRAPKRNPPGGRCDLPQLQAIGFPSVTLRPQQTCPLCPSLAPKPCSQLLDREASSAPEPRPPHPTQGSRQYPPPPPVSDPPRARGQSLQLDRRWWVKGDVDQSRFTPATYPPSSRKPPTGLSGEAREQPSYGGNSPPQARPDGELPFPRPDAVPYVGDVIPPSTSQTSWVKGGPHRAGEGVLRTHHRHRQLERGGRVGALLPHLLLTLSPLPGPPGALSSSSWGRHSHPVPLHPSYWNRPRLTVLSVTTVKVLPSTPGLYSFSPV